MRKNNKLTILLEEPLPDPAMEINNNARNNQRRKITTTHPPTFALHPRGEAGTTAA